MTIPAYNAPVNDLQRVSNRRQELLNRAKARATQANPDHKRQAKLVYDMLNWVLTPSLGKLKGYKPFDGFTYSPTELRQAYRLIRMVIEQSDYRLPKRQRGRLEQLGKKLRQPPLRSA